jgi:hypothetical protein
MCRAVGLGLLRRSEGRQRDLAEVDPRSSMTWSVSLAVSLMGLLFDFGSGLRLVPST